MFRVPLPVSGKIGPTRRSPKDALAPSRMTGHQAEAAPENEVPGRGLVNASAVDTHRPVGIEGPRVNLEETGVPDVDGSGPGVEFAV